jgi:hypothetical protein
MLISMQFLKPLLQLPIRFCPDTLAQEVEALPRSAWVPHPQGFVGNDAVPLVSPGGALTNSVRGPMEATDYLRACPYIMSLMAELGAVWGRSRLMGLAPNAEVRPHVDVHYYWRTHIRIHVPVITNPGVRFTCGGEDVHMAAGECWTFDSFQLHDVQNKGAERRVHLVIDTVGGERLWDLIDAAGQGTGPPADPWRPAHSAHAPRLRYEQINIPDLMSSWELRSHLDFLASHCMPHPDLAVVLRRLDKFASAWDAAWVEFGPGDEGLPAYRQLIDQVRLDLEKLGGDQIMLRNQAPLNRALNDMILTRAVARDEDKPLAADPRPVLAPSPRTPSPRAPSPVTAATSGPILFSERFDRPIFIVSLPRSGSSLLFETLARAPDLFTVGGESHGLIEGIEPFSPAAHDWQSNRLTAEDADPAAVEQLAQGFYGQLRDRAGHRPEGIVRVLEKTPKNALRVPFIDAVWPNSRFVYLYRDPRQTLASMIEAWVSGRFRTYPGLPGWEGPPWSLLLIPDWRDLGGRPIPDIVAQQWKATTETLISDLARIPPDRLQVVLYGELVARPQDTINRLTQMLGLAWDVQLGPELPMSKHTVSRPGFEKWRMIEPIIRALWPIVAEADEMARSFVKSRMA